MLSGRKTGVQAVKAWDILREEYPKSSQSLPSSSDHSARFKGQSAKKVEVENEVHLVPCSEGLRKSLRTRPEIRLDSGSLVADRPVDKSSDASLLPDKVDNAFRNSQEECVYRYKLPVVPAVKSDVATFDYDDMELQDANALFELEDAVKNDPEGLKKIISGYSKLYEWLIFKAREIERSGKSGRVGKKIQQWVATLDDICKGSGFSWRRLPLALNYDECSEEKCKKLFPGDKQEKDLLRENDGIMFFPPWVEKEFLGTPLSTVYNKYWCVRNTLGKEGSGLKFDSADFIQCYPNLHSWLKAINSASEEDFASNGLSPLESDALKYLLERTDAEANSVGGNPQWHWSSVAEMPAGVSHKVNQSILGSMSGQEELLSDLPAAPKQHLPAKTGKKGAKKRARPAINTDPLTADLGAHVHEGLSETRKRTSVQRTDTIDSSLLDEYLAMQDEGPSLPKKDKLSKKAVKLEVKIPLISVNVPGDYEQTSENVSTESLLVGFKRVYSSEGVMETESSEVPVLKLALIELDKLTQFEETDEAFTVAALKRSLPKAETIFLDRHCEKLTRSYTPKVDLFPFHKEGAELMQPVTSLANWVNGMREEYAGMLKEEATLVGKVAKAKDGSKKQLKRKLDALESKNDEYLLGHLGLFEAIIKAFRRRLDQVENHLAGNAEPFLKKKCAPANLVSSLKQLDKSLDDARAVLGALESHLEVLESADSYRERNSACKAMGGLKFETLESLF
ncbi:MAG: hypothetical protein ACR2PT_02540 [Endozoicomonas sp.]